MPTLSDAEIAQLAANAGWTGPDLDMAVAVALAESDGNTERLGDLGRVSATYGPSVGLWQIRSVNEGHGNAFDQAHRNHDANLDPATNAQNAYAIWQQPGRRGWREWGSVTDGRYQQFMDRARRAVGTQQTPAPQQRGDAGSGSGGNGMSAVLQELIGSLSKFGTQSNRLGQVAKQAQQTVARGGAFGEVPGSRAAEQGNQRNAGRSAKQAEGGRDRLDEVRDGVKSSGEQYERYDQDQGKQQGQERIQIDNAYDAYQNYA
jgi:lysozyme-like protein